MKGNRQSTQAHPNIILATVIALAVVVALTGCDIVGSGSESDSTPQPGGALFGVTDGVLTVSQGTAETEVAAGEEVNLFSGDRLWSGPDAGVTLKLPDESVLQLAPSTIAEVTTLSSQGEIAIRGLDGTITLQTKSDKVWLEMTSVTSFGLDSLDFKAVPASGGATMSMLVDDPEVRLVIEDGTAVLSINEVLYQAATGTEIKALPGVEPEVIVATTPEVGTPTPETPSESPSPVSGTSVFSQSYVYEAPLLQAPEDQGSVTSAANISLTWQSAVSVGPDEWYEIQLWQTTSAPYTVVGRTQNSNWSPDASLEAGDYRWRIQIVRLSDGAYLSPPSETWGFNLKASVPTGPVPTKPSVGLPTVPATSGAPSASSYSKPAAVSPTNDAVFEAVDTVTLTWDSAGTLGGDQWYEVRLWTDGTEWAGVGQTRSPSWQVPQDYNPGRYGWQVAVVVLQNGQWVKDISPQSDMRFFTWNPPPVQGGDDGGGDGGPPSER